MSKPYIHALSSAKKYGGRFEDYMPIHEFLDSSKSIIADNRHRAILHSSFGIFILVRVFGETFVNSDGKIISTRDIGEQHILEDFGGRFIPSAQDYLEKMDYVEWMTSGMGSPPSFARINEKRESKIKRIKIDND